MAQRGVKKKSNVPNGRLAWFGYLVHEDGVVFMKKTPY